MLGDGERGRCREEARDFMLLRGDITGRGGGRCREEGREGSVVILRLGGEGVEMLRKGKKLRDAQDKFVEG